MAPTYLECTSELGATILKCESLLARPELLGLLTQSQIAFAGLAIIGTLGTSYGVYKTYSNSANGLRLDAMEVSLKRLRERIDLLSENMVKLHKLDPAHLRSLVEIASFVSEEELRRLLGQ